MAYEIRNPDLVNHYSLETLQGFALDCLGALGASEEEAAIVSDGVLTAAQWWHPGQGQGLEKFSATSARAWRRHHPRPSR